MVTKKIYARNKGINEQVWIYLNYFPTDEVYSINAGYYHCDVRTEKWYGEEQEYDLNDYLDRYPEWAPKISQLQQEIEAERP